jgi:hypothetical protein
VFFTVVNNKTRDFEVEFRVDYISCTTMPRRSKHSYIAIDRHNSSSVANGRFCRPLNSYEDVGDEEDIFSGEDMVQDLERAWQSILKWEESSIQNYSSSRIFYTGKNAT